MSYEEKIVELLAIIYNKIPWQKIKTNKNPHDIFNHRVRSASRRGSIEEFVSRLCNYFGIQSLPVESYTLIKELEGKDWILNKVFVEHIPICLKAIVLAKEKRKKKNDIEEDIEDIEDIKEVEYDSEI